MGFPREAKLAEHLDYEGPDIRELFALWTVWESDCVDSIANTILEGELLLGAWKDSGRDNFHDAIMSILPVNKVTSEQISEAMVKLGL